MRAFGSRKNAARACSTSPLPLTPAEPPLPKNCRVQLYGQIKAPARARRNLARSQSPQPTALPLRTHPRLRRREVSHQKQVSVQAAASEAGACRRTGSHSSDTLTATITMMLGNQNRDRAPPLAAKKRAASRPEFRSLANPADIVLQRTIQIAKEGTSCFGEKVTN